LAGYPWSTPWLLAACVLYAITGCCWLPVLRLQWCMRALARQADQTSTALPPLYWHQARCWFWLGVCAFLAMLVLSWLMVAKPWWQVRHQWLTG
ncbi:MAG: DUF2269 family protein, partial [Janthinobacterium lividum]